MPCSCSTPSPSTTCRSSTFASARACGATTSSSPSRPAARRRWTRTPRLIARFAPGAGEAFLAALNAALGGGGVVAELAEAAGTTEQEVNGIAALFDARDFVILYGERLLSGPRADHAARALLNVAAKGFDRGHDGAGLLEIPSGTNGRGLREVGCASGRSAPEIAEAAGSGDLSALYLLHTDPLAELPGGGRPRSIARPP